jgi:hypothetical protein
MAGIETQDDDNWTPPKDGSWIPTVRMQEAVGKERDRATEALSQAAELRAQLAREQEARVRLEEQVNKAPKESEKPTVTRAQLRKKVEEGTITQEQADEFMDAQMRESLKKDMKVQLEEHQQVTARSEMVRNEVEKYIQIDPELDTNGSDSKKQFNTRFNELVDLGYGATPETELLALREIYGPSNRLKEKTRDVRDTHGETHTPNREGSKQSNSEVPKGITDKLRSHYEKCFEIGMYPGGWENADVKEELKYAKKD